MRQAEADSGARPDLLSRQNREEIKKLRNLRRPNEILIAFRVSAMGQASDVAGARWSAAVTAAKVAKRCKAIDIVAVDSWTGERLPVLDSGTADVSAAGAHMPISSATEREVATPSDAAPAGLLVRCRILDGPSVPP